MAYLDATLDLTVLKNQPYLNPTQPMKRRLHEACHMAIASNRHSRSHPMWRKTGETWGGGEISICGSRLACLTSPQSLSLSPHPPTLHPRPRPTKYFVSHVHLLRGGYSSAPTLSPRGARARPGGSVRERPRGYPCRVRTDIEGLWRSATP